MTTITFQPELSAPKFNLKRVFLVIVFIAIGLSAHAVIKHGAEALAIRNCLDNNGPFMVFQNKYDKDTFYRICKFEDNKYGLQAVIKTANGLQEKTAFIKGDGTWKALYDYMCKIATKYTGLLQ